MVMASIPKLQGPASLLILARQSTRNAPVPRSPTPPQHIIQTRHDSTSRPSGQQSLRASYYRGGTSRGIIVKEHRLPPDREAWGPILRGALGSPDPSGRQLDGLGTGISSLSKVCVVEKSQREDTDVDYTFIQVGVRNGELDYSSNCGNMSAAVGPFAMNSGLMGIQPDGELEVCIFDTNTNKIIKSRFQIAHREALTEGPFAIDGVAGTAAKIELAFQDPAGSRTGKLLPTGNVVDILGPGIDASCVDVANPCIFVRAADLNVDGTILPSAGDAHPTLLARLEAIRRSGAVKMGLATDEASVPEAAPKIIMVAPPATYTALSGVEVDVAACDLLVRSVSGKNMHRAVQ
jgi:2-methylaconitate cis-trans-isomerase PrpF